MLLGTFILCPILLNKPAAFVSFPLFKYVVTIAWNEIIFKVLQQIIPIFQLAPNLLFDAGSAPSTYKRTHRIPPEALSLVDFSTVASLEKKSTQENPATSVVHRYKLL